MITLYNVVSADGYIADENGQEDFIPEEVWGDFLDICRENEVVVFGRKTYEAIQRYSSNLIQDFEDLNIKKVVVTDNKKFIVKPVYEIIYSIDGIKSLGKNILVSSGPTLNDSLLKTGMVDNIVLNKLSEKIGTGIKPFTDILNLTPVSEKNIRIGQTMSIYKVNVT